MVIEQIQATVFVRTSRTNPEDDFWGGETQLQPLARLAR
jgi:hypothetical protein